MEKTAQAAVKPQKNNNTTVSLKTTDQDLHRLARTLSD